MTCLDVVLPTPEENLACDEALLDLCEIDGADEILRFWEPQSYFVVLGYGNRVAEEVNREICAAQKIPVLRRCSGGGTVLQGPGCLNYALILRIDEREPLHSIPTTNGFVMRRHRDALRELLGESVRAAGHTDLALGDLKFSGNAQRRRKNCLLFHGTFLVDFDIGRVAKLLRFPSRPPAYRQDRAHQDFLCNLPLGSALIREAIQKAWGTTKTLRECPREQISKLVEEKYSRTEWNLRF